MQKVMIIGAFYGVLVKMMQLKCEINSVLENKGVL